MGAQLVIPDRHVHSGGTVRGTFKFQVRDCTFERVYLKFVGKEITRRDSDKKTRHLRGRVNVVKQYMTILGGPKGSNFKGQLPGGDYEFPFEFQIPPNAPSSLLSVSEAKVEYYVLGRVGDYWVRQEVWVASRMPSSQYISRFAIASRPSQFNVVTCCCMDSGRTEVHLELPYNAYVFGKDTSIAGTVVINNAESTAPCRGISIHVVRTNVRRLYEWDMSGKLEKEVKFTDYYIYFNMHTFVRNVYVAEGETQLKRFNFVLPLPHANDKQLASCYRGVNVDYFYELVVYLDGDDTPAHSMPIIMASGEDPTNRCPPIDMAAPTQAIAPGAYHKSVYPHGQVAGVVMPQQPPVNIPQPPPAHVAQGGLYDRANQQPTAQPATHAPLVDTEASAFVDI